MGLFYGENINYNLVYYFSNITVILYINTLKIKFGKSISIVHIKRYKNGALKTLNIQVQEIKKEEKDQDKDFIIALIQLLQRIIHYYYKYHLLPQ